MPLPHSLSAYTHVQPVLDAAFAAEGPSRYELASAKAAVRWRQEAYMYRKLLAATGDNSLSDMVLTVDGPVVVIDRRAPTGVLTTHDGTHLPLEAPRAAPDTAEGFAADFARRLGLDVED